jgi:hypothetical protein
LFKPTNAKSITAMDHHRETLQESGNVLHPMDWTLPGKQTDFRFVDENAEDSILRNNEHDSIETDERELQLWKQEEPRISTFRGMTIDGREELENAEDSILRNNEHDSIKTDERD